MIALRPHPAGRRGGGRTLCARGFAPTHPLHQPVLIRKVVGRMSNGNKNPRSKGGGGGQGGGQGGNQQRRRRGRSPQSAVNQSQQAHRGPVMTSLGESTYEAVFDHG